MIGITGATGLVGFTLCSHLLDLGYVLKLFVRNPNDECLKDLDATIVQGDLNNLDALDQFCKSVHTVIPIIDIILVNHKNPIKKGIEKIQSLLILFSVLLIILRKVL